jgi:hypothetical protein
MTPGCTDDDADRSAATVADAEPTGHSVRLDVTLRPDDDGTTVSFLTPAVSVFSMPASSIAGRPYYVAVFEGGFDQGVDLDLHHEWGTIPEDLHVSYTSPARFADGPYDIAFIVYTQTEITQAMRDDYFGVVPKAGELSAFSLSQERVLPGDPGFSNGVVRANVQGSDGEVFLENRHDAADVVGSLNDTVLTVP